MIYSKQLFYHQPDRGSIGDCHRTAIACLLDLEPEQVPHFGEHHFGDGAAFNRAVRQFLAGRGLVPVDVIYGCSLEELLAMMGHMNPTARYLLGGRSANGVNHTVVGCGGRIEWDPSMDDSGIVGPCDDGFYWVTWLVPIALAS